MKSSLFGIILFPVDAITVLSLGFLAKLNIKHVVNKFNKLSIREDNAVLLVT
jgi:hypothetical protein